MAQEQCRLDGCELPGTLRGGFCTEAHRDEHKRAGWRLRKKRQRAADNIEHVAASDGRSRPGAGPDAHQPATEYAPSRRWARREEPELVDLTVPGATDRGYQTNRVLQRQHVQRYTPPRVGDDAWVPQDEEYYSGVDFRARNDMSQGPYGGYNHAGTPVAFQVVRRSR